MMFNQKKYLSFKLQSFICVLIIVSDVKTIPEQLHQHLEKKSPLSEKSLTQIPIQPNYLNHRFGRRNNADMPKRFI